MAAVLHLETDPYRRPIWIPSVYKIAIATAITFAQAQKLWQRKKNGASDEQGRNDTASPVMHLLSLALNF